MRIIVFLMALSTISFIYSKIKDPSSQQVVNRALAERRFYIQNKRVLVVLDLLSHLLFFAGYLILMICGLKTNLLLAVFSGLEAFFSVVDTIDTQRFLRDIEVSKGFTILSKRWYWASNLILDVGYLVILLMALFTI